MVNLTRLASARNAEAPQLSRANREPQMLPYPVGVVLELCYRVARRELDVIEGGAAEDGSLSNPIGRPAFRTTSVDLMGSFQRGHRNGSGPGGFSEPEGVPPGLL